VLAQARKFVFQKTLREGAVSLKQYLLKMNASCYVSKPMILLTPTSDQQARDGPVLPKERETEANCIHGEVILAQAERFDQKATEKGSSTHKIQNYALHGNCYCVINRSLSGLHSSRARPDKNKIPPLIDRID
jgi:hypothetical protein